MYSKRLESFGELPKDKRPPRYMWDRPYELGQFLEHVWDSKEEQKTKSDVFYRYDEDEVE
jgi:hypothetical protein